MKEGDLYEGQVLSKGWTSKTTGNGTELIVRDPNFLTEDGYFKKHRKKITNVTPKKKKRKK